MSADFEARLNIPFFSAYLRYHRIFRHYVGRRIYFLSVLGILGGYLDSIGIAMFIPLMSVFLGKSGVAVEGNDHRFLNFINSILQYLDLDENPVRIISFVLFLFVLKGVFKFIFGVYQAYISAKMVHDLTDELTDALGKVRYRAFLDQDSGNLTNVMTNEVNRMSGAFLGFASTVPAVASMAASAVIAFVVDWRLTLATLAFGAAVLLASRVTFRQSRKYSHLLSKRYSTLYGLLIQTIASFKYLSATARFQHLQNRISTECLEIQRIGVRSAATSQIINALLEPVVLGFLLAVLFFQSRAGETNVTTLALLAMLSYRIMSQITVFQGAWQRFSASIGNVDTVIRTLRNLRSEADIQSGNVTPEFVNFVEVRDVSFSYGDRNVLDKVSLRIGKNEQIAFVGESGSGKSTLIDLLCGLLTPSSGSILINGGSGNNIDWKKFRKQIGYVTQDSLLFNDTIRNNLSFWEKDINSADGESRVRDSIGRAHLSESILEMPDQLETIIGDRGSRLSGGQRQRLSLARELYKNPSILILDEATSSLDAESEEVVRKTIDDLKGRATTIIVAHRLHTVRNCDRIYVLSRGKIIESGTYDDLYEKMDSVFRRLCDLQNQG